MRRVLLSLPILLILTVQQAFAIPAPLPTSALPAWHSHERVALTDAQESAWLDLVVQHSPHKRALETAKLLFPDTDLGIAPPVLTQGSWLYASKAKALPAKKGRRLYGYLPYWTMKGAKLHWAELTQLSYFCAELSSASKFTNLHGWGSKDAKALIALAHKNGVQVPLTITLFSKSGIHTVLATAAKRSALVQKVIDLVVSGGGDGVNIDFEGMALADKAAMSAFINELNIKMKKQLPGADVTLATPAVDWSGAWDYDYLAEHSDGLMVMAYGLHWSGGPPGPNLPMGTGGPWKHKTLPWVVDDYMKYGKAKNKHKFILGLPLYGHAWPSSSAALGAKSLGKAKSVTYEKGIIEAPTKGGWKWDNTSQSSYYVYKSAGQWTQAWSDTAAAFDLRVKYLDKRETQMGLWALGYADKSAPVWKSISWFMTQGKPAGGADAGDTSSTPDAGAADTGVADAGPADSGTSDTGVIPLDASNDNQNDTTGPGADTQSPDIKPVDNKKDSGGNAEDAGAIDSGAPGDIKPVDNKKDSGGSVDVGSGTPKDGATPSDSGPMDGTGLAQDGGTTELAPTTNLAPKADSGCSVRNGHALGSAGPSAAAFWLMLLAGALIWRRRRIA